MHIGHKACFLLGPDPVHFSSKIRKPLRHIPTIHLPSLWELSIRQRPIVQPYHTSFNQVREVEHVDTIDSSRDTADYHKQPAYYYYNPQGKAS